MTTVRRPEALRTSKGTPAPTPPSRPSRAPRHNPGNKALVAGALLVVVCGLGLAQAGTDYLAALAYRSPEESSGTETGSLYGSVIDPEGKAIPGASVAVQDTTFGTTTDSAGWYRIPAIRVGTYDVKASKAGYATVTQKIRIESSFPRPLDFTLAPGGKDSVIDARIPVPTSDLRLSAQIWVVTSVVFSLAVLAGAFLAVTRRTFPAAAVAAGLGILTIGFVLGAVLSIVALLLLFLGRREFLPADAAAAVPAGTLRRRAAPSGGEAEATPVEVEVAEEMPEEEPVPVPGPAGAAALGGPAVTAGAVPVDEIASGDTVIAEGGLTEGDMERALKSALRQPSKDHDVVADVIKKLRLEAPDAIRAGRDPGDAARRRRPLDSDPGKRCRVCVRPIVSMIETYTCECRQILHKRCAEDEGRCPSCGVGVPFDI